MSNCVRTLRNIRRGVMHAFLSVGCMISVAYCRCLDSVAFETQRQSHGGPSPPTPEPHQWSNFIGGTLNSVSREHKPHYMFRTTPYIDIEILHKHNQQDQTLDWQVKRKYARRQPPAPAASNALVFTLLINVVASFVSSSQPCRCCAAGL